MIWLLLLYIATGKLGMSISVNQINIALCMKRIFFTAFLSSPPKTMSPYNFQSSFSTDTQEDDGFTFRRARPREEENFNSLTTQGIKRHAVDDFDDDFKEFQRSTSSAKRVHYTERTSTRQSEASLASEASYKVTGEKATARFSKVPRILHDP